MFFVLGVLAIIGLFVSVLFVVSALFFLIRVPNLLQDISYYLRKLAEASVDDKHFDDHPSDDVDDGMRYF